MKILISTPAYNHQVNNEMVNSLLQSISYLKASGHIVNWHSPTSSALAFNRNLSVDLAIKEGYDWLLFWDGDISVEEPDFIEKMVELGHKTTADIVGFPVVLKGKPKNYNCAFRHGLHGYLNIDATLGISGEPFSVDVIGTGIMLIWVNLFKKMKTPYFTFTDTYNEQPGFFPEDWNFCEKASEHTKIYADPRFSVKHWGITPFS